jgi:hypothetical protein
MLKGPKLTSVTWSITECILFPEDQVPLKVYDTLFSVTGIDLNPERYGFPPDTIQGLNLITDNGQGWVIASAGSFDSNFCGDPGTELPNGGDTSFGVYTSVVSEYGVYNNLRALLIFLTDTGEISGETYIDGLTVEWKRSEPMP